jgi:FkbM family methyltransferase
MQLFELIQPERLTAVVDVGAAAIDAPPPYLPMLRYGLCTVAAFDPLTDPIATRCFPYAIGDGNDAELKICAAPGMTSLFEPDPKALALFPRMPLYGEVVKRSPVLTRRLDDVPEVAIVDFLTMDVQGSELAVLCGARKKLQTSVFVQCEVAFIPLYSGQPVFRDIDNEMNDLGFVFHTFCEDVGFGKRTIAPYRAEGSINQWQGADAVYVRDFGRLDRLDEEQLKHMALIAHYCYGSHDLAWRCIGELAARGVFRDERNRLGESDDRGQHRATAMPRYAGG